MCSRTPQFSSGVPPLLAGNDVFRSAPSWTNLDKNLNFDAESFDRDRQIGANREVSRFSAARTRTLPPASSLPAPQLFRARHIVPSRLTHRVLSTPIPTVCSGLQPKSPPSSPRPLFSNCCSTGVPIPSNPPTCPPRARMIAPHNHDRDALLTVARRARAQDRCADRVWSSRRVVGLRCRVVLLLWVCLSVAVVVKGVAVLAVVVSASSSSSVCRRTVLVTCKRKPRTTIIYIPQTRHTFICQRCLRQHTSRPSAVLNAARTSAV